MAAQNQEHQQVLSALGVSGFDKGDLTVYSPIDGLVLARLPVQAAEDAARACDSAQRAFAQWRQVPAPVRGELVRLFGDVLRESKQDLGRLVSIECGKIFSEGLGEVQEMIDICDYATGLSRQLFGLTIASERPGHHMRELWHPLGPTLIITAFNFPVAVWAWNAALALVCGNSVLWKPSEKTPLCALAVQRLFDKALDRFQAAGHSAPQGLSQVLIGERELGRVLCARKDIPLVSATGSVSMGRAVAQTVAGRLGRSLLELGGNNAMIVRPDANLDMAVRAILFGAVGTCGQRCTSLRRLIVHGDVYDRLTQSLVKAYGQVRIGDPLAKETLVGPLVDEAAYESMQAALAAAQQQGGKILCGGARVKGPHAGGFYVAPCIVAMPSQTDIVRHETFAPILYVMKENDFEAAVAMNNDVPQGLSSCIFTENARAAERFLSATGSDCGIANVNIGPSGAEIGGAFGGEKETGGGRESGSDSWKTYMRRQTQTVNYSDSMPLAQGVVFDL